MKKYLNYAYDKVQKEILTEFLKEGMIKRRKFCYDVITLNDDTEVIGIVKNGVMVMLIPFSIFGVSTRVFKQSENEINLSNILFPDCYNDRKLLAPTNEIIVNDKNKLVKFCFEDNTEVYYNEEQLKYFYPLEGKQFEAVSNLSLMYISENNRLLGAVLPVRYNKKEG